MSQYERLKRKERQLKDVVFLSLFGVPAVVAIITNSPMASAVAFFIMLIPSWLLYSVIIKHFDDIYIAHRNSEAFHHPRDQFGRFINE